MPVVAGLTALRLPLILGSALIALLLMTAGCNEPEAPAPAEPAPAPVVKTTPATQAQLDTLTLFQSTSTELLEELVSCLKALDQQGTEFLTNTDEAKLKTLKQQWQLCQLHYQASQVLVGFDPAHEQRLQAVHANLGQTLTMPGFIDSVQQYPFSGIVNDASLPLDEVSLREQHGVTDEAEVSIGMEVVAFLLWGEQHFNPELKPRPISDYEEISSWDDSTTDLPISEHPNNRRRRLLALCLQLLIADSKALIDAWNTSDLPESAEAITDWQSQQRASLVAALAIDPPNTVLLSQVKNWLDEAAIPGVTSQNSTNETKDKPKADEDPAKTAAHLLQLLSPASGESTAAPAANTKPATKQG